jgi:HEAT repeat protein
VRRGWRVALITLAAGIAVLAAASLALKDPLLEKWWLHRLGSEDPEAQRAAADGLGRLGSLKAIGPLLAKTRDPHHGYMVVFLAAAGGLENIITLRGKAAAPFLLEAVEKEMDPTARAFATALLRVADPSIPTEGPPDRIDADPYRIEFRDPSSPGGQDRPPGST